jgi:hypothetical protein
MFGFLPRLALPTFGCQFFGGAISRSRHANSLAKKK